jgi:hypothetical protein
VSVGGDSGKKFPRGAGCLSRVRAAIQQNPLFALQVIVVQGFDLLQKFAAKLCWGQQKARGCVR